MIPNTLDGELFRRKLRKDYSAYVSYVNEPFDYCMTKFHKYLCDQIQEFLEVRTDKAMDILLISVPPQHGKSFTVTETLPSWYLGNHPSDGVILCSYDGTIAEGFSRRNRDKFVEYGKDVFSVGPNPQVQGVGLWETERGGRCRAAGLKAGITSFGAELFIIDDPIKNKEQAQSEAIISKIHDEMGPSVQSRIHPGGKLIVIQTRWVENDVVGYVEKNWSEFIYKVINLPCECEDPDNDPLGRKLGDALMGEHLGDFNIPAKIRNDNKWLKSKKLLVKAGDGDYTWNALYQGHPTAQDGNLFKEGWWKYYERSSLKFEQMEFSCLSVDASFKQTETSDMVAMELWSIYRNEFYLWKLVNKRMGFVDTCNRIRQICKEFPTIDQLIIEDKANGSAIIDTFKYMEGMPTVIGVNPVGGKYARAQAVSPTVSTGICNICTDWTQAEIDDMDWSGKEKNLLPHQMFVIQHAKFPFMKNDDMVDADTQALARLIKMLTGEEARPQKRVLRYVKWYPDMWEDFDNMSPLEQEQFIVTYGAPLEWMPGYDA